MDNILIVEDDLDMCNLLSDILEEECFLTDKAHDGKSAIRKIKRHKYDLMILDYKLPGSSGLVVLEEAKQIRQKLMVMMISAYGNEHIKAKAKKLGAIGFLDKPFDVEKLVRKVKNILAKKNKMRLTAPRRGFSPHKKAESK